MSAASTALNPLVEKIRAKYPGAYDDMDDATLTKKVLAKYPQYSDLAAPPMQQPVKPQELPMTGTEQAGANVAGGLVGAGDMLAKGALKVGNQLYESSTPHIAQQIYKKLNGQPNELDKVPEHAVMTFLGMGGVPEAEAGEAAAVAPRAEQALPAEAAAKAPEVAAPAPTADPVTDAAAAPSKLAPTYRDATLNRRNFPDNAGEDYGDLKAATKDVVDSAVPASANRGVNLTTKAQIDMKLRNGDVEGAEQVLDQAAKKANPSYTAPDRPQIVPATQNIRENDALVSSAENASPKQVRGYREAQDDAGVSQEMRANLDTHGYRAESEARREFIARNSTGTTKGEMAQQVTTKPVDPSSLSLEEKLRIMLEAARAAKQ